MARDPRQVIRARGVRSSSSIAVRSALLRIGPDLIQGVDVDMESASVGWIGVEPAGNLEPGSGQGLTHIIDGIEGSIWAKGIGPAFSGRLDYQSNHPMLM